MSAYDMYDMTVLLMSAYDMYDMTALLMSAYDMFFFFSKKPLWHQKIMVVG